MIIDRIKDFGFGVSNRKVCAVSFAADCLELLICNLLHERECGDDNAGHHGGNQVDKNREPQHQGHEE